MALYYKAKRRGYAAIADEEETTVKKRILSLALALALCLGLAVPTMAAGTTETLINEENGVKITLENLLRVETHRYKTDGGYQKMTIYVIEDSSVVSMEALEGRKYAQSDEDYRTFYEYYYSDNPSESGFAYCDLGAGLAWGGDGGFLGWGDEEVPMTGPWAIRMDFSEGNYGLRYVAGYNITIESDFSHFVPVEGGLLAADWAADSLEKAYDAFLFQRVMEPFEEDCARAMTRAEFAAAAVNLYAALQGKYSWDLDVDYRTPFTDVSDSMVGYAYNLGLINGTSETTFNPDDTLTREQAAAILARVYSAIHGDIPTVTATAFADDSTIGSWAKSEVAFMADKGIVNGVGDNSFAPQRTLSVQEAMVMAQRMLENLK